MDQWNILGIDASLLSGLAFALTGALLSLYFWFNPRQIRGKIRYKVSCENSYTDRIWRYGSFPIHIDIWNPSAAGIDGKDIREPLKIVFPETVVVREASVSGAAGGFDTAKVKISGVDTNVITAHWAFLDPGMAFQLELDPRPADKDVSDVRLFRPIRSAGRGWVKISGRFKDFVLEEPLDLEDLPEHLRIAAGAAFASTVMVLCYLLMLAVVPLIPASDLVFSSNLAKSIGLAVFGAAVVAVGIFSIVGLDTATKFILNTKSPIEKLRKDHPVIGSIAKLS